MKILFLSHTAKWAGAESTLAALLAGLDPTRHEPVVVLPTNGPLQDRLEDLGVPFRFGSMVHWIGQASTGDWKRLADGLGRRVESMARHIERERCDLVFTNTSVVLEAALAARRVGVPHVWRIHEMLERHDNLRSTLPLEAHYQLLDALADSVAVVSKCVRSVLAPHVSSERIDVVVNGVAKMEDPAATRADLFGPDAAAPLVVFVGTLSEAKGVPLLPRIMQRVVEQVPTAVCVLIGEDVGAGAGLRREIESRKLSRAFRLLGFRPDVIDLVARADVLLLPSRVDSLPCAVMEAMAVGVPSIATRSGGAEELILDEETGVLVDVDDVEAMARGLVQLLTNEPKRKQMGQRARERARSDFSLAGSVQAFEVLFDRVARAPSSPAPDTTAAIVEWLAAGGRGVIPR